MDVRKKEIEELQSQARALSQEGKSTDEVDGKRLTVEKKFLELLEPLNERKANLLASKEIHQFNRDVEDEIVSIKEIVLPRQQENVTAIAALSQEETSWSCLSVTCLSDAAFCVWCAPASLCCPSSILKSHVLFSSYFQLWVGERMPIATSTDHGHNLQTVQLLIKKNQVSRCCSSSIPFISP